MRGNSAAILLVARLHLLVCWFARSIVTLAVLFGAFTLLSCGSENAAEVELEPEVPGWLNQPSGALPQTLSDVGLYPDGNLNSPHPRAIAYDPLHPLWSNGSEKHRYVVLPEGTSIDTTVSNDWGFPEGTLLSPSGPCPLKIDVNIVWTPFHPDGFCYRHLRTDGDKPGRKHQETDDPA